MNKALLLDALVDVPELGDELIAASNPERGISEGVEQDEAGGWGERRQAERAGGNILLHELGQKVLVLADAGVELVVGGLDGLGLVEAGLGEGAGEEGDGDAGGQNAVGVMADDGRGWPDGETVGNGPVLDHLRQPLLLELVGEDRRVRASRQRGHVCCLSGDARLMCVL